MGIQESLSRNRGTGFFAKWVQNQAKIEDALLTGSPVEFGDLVEGDPLLHGPRPLTSMTLEMSRLTSAIGCTDNARICPSFRAGVKDRKARSGRTS
jgi:hypothetical protein